MLAEPKLHLDCRDLICDAHGFAFEHPVVGQIIDPVRRLDGVIGAGVGLRFLPLKHNKRILEQKDNSQENQGPVTGPKHHAKPNNY